MRPYFVGVAALQPRSPVLLYGPLLAGVAGWCHCVWRREMAPGKVPFVASHSSTFEALPEWARKMVGEGR